MVGAILVVQLIVFTIVKLESETVAQIGAPIFAGKLFGFYRGVIGAVESALMAVRLLGFPHLRDELAACENKSIQRMDASFQESAERSHRWVVGQDATIA